MTNLIALKAANAIMWKNCEILPSRQSQVNAIVARLCAMSAKLRYQQIALATGVPWYVIAVIHEREADQKWDRQLGQGDPLNEMSKHVPRGRGPFHDHGGFDAFYWGAVDALTNCPPYAARWKDWSPGGVLTLLVLYNGTGYFDYHHEPSPYDWGATNQEQRGKYIGDGVYSPQVWDTQVGCAAMLKGMMAVDKTITFATQAS